MKNRNGFTLIELIATIGIMLLIGIVIANNMTGLLSKNQDEEYNEYVKQIEESACTYVELKKPECKYSGCNVTLKELIESGYIAEDLKNPKTKKAVKDEKEKEVKVSWNSESVKECKMKE